LAARYEAARRDADLKRLDNELALADAMTIDHLERRGAELARWDDAVKVYQRVKAAMTKKDLTGVSAALSDLDRIFSEAQRDTAESRDRLIDLIDLRRRLVSTEAKRERAAQQTMTLEQAMTLVGAIVAAIQAEIHDRAIQARIGRRIDQLLGGVA
jgi:hypothetical protein